MLGCRGLRCVGCWDARGWGALGYGIPRPMGAGMQEVGVHGHWGAGMKETEVTGC